VADGSTDGVKQLNLTGNMQFILDNPDFESQRLAHPERKGYLGITKSEDEYVIYSGQNDVNVERASFTKEELRTLWVMLFDVWKAKSIKKDTAINMIRCLELFHGACEYYGIEPKKLARQNRKLLNIKRRKVVFYLLNKHSLVSVETIADLFGYSTHATILHHIRDMDNLLSKEYGDIEVQYDYQQLLKHLKLSNHDKKTNETNGH